MEIFCIAEKSWQSGRTWISLDIHTSTFNYCNGNVFPTICIISWLKTGQKSHLSTCFESFSLTHGKNFIIFDKSYLWLSLKTIRNYLASDVAVCCWQEFCLLPNLHSRAHWSLWGSSSPEPASSQCSVLNLFQCIGIKSHIPLYF